MATITIPAEYLEDARCALTHEIQDDGEALNGQSPDERPSSTLILKRDMQLLELLLDATEDVTVEVEDDRVSDPVLDMVETMARQVVGRLDRECVYGPLPIGEMLPIVEELRWAMAEGARLNPAEVA
jgi:hypothetical protein